MAADFAVLVSVSKHTLYAWKKRFEEEGPAGLMDRPRGTAKGSKLPRPDEAGHPDDEGVQPRLGLPTDQRHARAGPGATGDLGTRLLRIANIYPDAPCGGWGSFMSYEAFVTLYSRPKQGDQLCENCAMPFPLWQFTKTGIYEYYTMDLDPETMLCGTCYETERESRIPDDPNCIDAWTPLVSHAR